MSTTQYRHIAPNDPRAPSSTCNQRSKSHSIVKLEPQEVAIPSQESSVLHYTLPINNPPMSKPTSKAYYAIKPELQESKSSTQKAWLPRLSPAVLQELWAIWKSDPRVPTVDSRRAWAVSRNTSLTHVHQWFYIRKRKAKKAGKPISNDTYELSLEPRAVPLSLEVNKELVSPSPSPSPSPLPSYSDMTDVDSSSDGALVSFDSDCFLDKTPFYIPSRSSLTPAPSISPEPMDEHAYMRYCAPGSPVSRTLTPEAMCEQKMADSEYVYSPMPTLSLYVDANTDNDADGQDSFHTVCNQGDSEVSDFTCPLCGHVEDLSQINIDQLVEQSQSIFPFNPSLAAFPTPARLDPAPDTLMELSAIPYMFCTPPPFTVPAPFYSSTSWIEEELTKVLADDSFEVAGVTDLDLSLMDWGLLG